MEHSPMVLVTGATGFIGMHLVRQLLESGYEVRVYSRQSFKLDNKLNLPRECWITGELYDEGQLESACKGVETVYHLAGLAHVGGLNLRAALQTNLRGTQALYAAAHSAGVSTFIFISSVLAAYPKQSAYARSKRDAEEFLLSSASHSSMVIKILRPATVYGPGMRGNIPGFIRLARTGCLPALPALSKTIPFVSVKDLCSIATEIGRGLSSDSENIYVITDGESYNPNRIESAVYAGLGRKTPGWRIPKYLLFFCALIASLADILRLKRNNKGLRLYRNLIDGRQLVSDCRQVHYDFTPSTNFESEMPKIIDSLKLD